MKEAYLDSSIVVAIYCVEIHSARAEKAVSGLSVRYLSQKTEVEVAHALRFKVDRGELSREGGYAAWSQFLQHIQHGVYRRCPVTSDHWARTMELAWMLEQRVRSLDAIHLSVAEAYQVGFASLDKRQLKGAQELHLPLLQVGDEEE